MKELIIKYLKGKTLFVIIHALQYIKYMEQIIHKKNCRIECVGFFKQIQNQEFFCQ